MSDIDRLIGVHPDLVAKVAMALAAMQAIGMPMRVTEGVRSGVRQMELYAQGRMTPGRIVTNADGVTHKSNHQVKEDGYGHACDLAFLGPDPYLEHDPRGQAKWRAYGAIAQALGCTWGGAWAGMLDETHIESPYLASSKGPASLGT